MANLTHHYESSAFVTAAVEKVFDWLDDHTHLSSHMSESSWMMGGGRMTIELDEQQGKSVGSRIRLRGRILGMKLSVDEVVTERNPPHSKAWQTTGSPELLVIDRYRMGFEIAARDESSVLRVYIDYILPERGPARWLGYLLGDLYARWCTQKVVADAVKHFASLTDEVMQQQSTPDPHHR